MAPWTGFAPWAARMDELLRLGWPSALVPEEFSPGVELLETDKEFALAVDVPGVDRKDITIDVIGRRVRVHGTKTGHDRDGVLRHSTRTCGSFSYETVLPTALDESAVQASLKDGVLEVVLPKAVETKTTHIEIT